MSNITIFTLGATRHGMAAKITVAAPQQVIAAIGMELGGEDNAAVANIHARYAGRTLPGGKG